VYCITATSGALVNVYFLRCSFTSRIVLYDDTLTHRLELKVAAGAVVIITQPPLMWTRFQQFMNRTQAQSLQQHSSSTRILVGIPVMGCAADIAVWCRLCGITVSDLTVTNATVTDPTVSSGQYCDAEQLMLQSLNSSTVAEFETAHTAWLECVMLQLRAASGNGSNSNSSNSNSSIAGVHVMAISAPAKALALRLAQRGIFNTQ
jgi:hypothetical protein